jgi:hypothetical protein
VRRDFPLGCAWHWSSPHRSGSGASSSCCATSRGWLRSDGWFCFTETEKLSKSNSFAASGYLSYYDNDLCGGARLLTEKFSDRTSIGRNKVSSVETLIPTVYRPQGFATVLLVQYLTNACCGADLKQERQVKHLAGNFGSSKCTFLPVNVEPRVF